MAGSRRVPDSAVTPVESKLLQRGGELATLTGRQYQILLERQSHHPNMIRPYFEEVYAWEDLSRHRKTGDNQRRRNRAFHHGYLRSLRCTDCWLLNAILPSAL